jgi:hypothetical protein
MRFDRLNIVSVTGNFERSKAFPICQLPFVQMMFCGLLTILVGNKLIGMAI